MRNLGGDAERRPPSRKPSTKHEIPSIYRCAPHVEMAKQAPPWENAARVPSPGNGYPRFELVLSILCSVFRPRMRSTTWRLHTYSYARPFRGRIEPLASLRAQLALGTHFLAEAPGGRLRACTWCRALGTLVSVLTLSACFVLSAPTRGRRYAGHEPCRVCRVLRLSYKPSS